MDLRELKRNWDIFGKKDPMWAVLTDPDKRLGNWDPDEFFQTGRVEISRVLEHVDAAAANAGGVLRRGRALDFGCAVGRLSQALAEYFERVDGVDIAPSMIEQARQLNRHGDKCVYHVNEADDLSLFPDGSFDFIYTAHVMQHMEKRYQERYFKEFVRVLAPGGFALVEMVTRLVTGATSPLPEEAFRAKIEVSEVPATFAPRSRTLIRATVRNESPQVLPSAGTDGWLMVTLANRWVPDGGTMVVDDAHGFLPGDIPPGESAEVTLCVTAPDRPGRYQLELDCVQEGVAWFGDRGSTPTRVPVQVRAPRRRWFRPRAADKPVAPAAIADADEAIMEMHGVPEEEVKGWVEGAGGQLIEIVDWDDFMAQRSTDWHRAGYLTTK